MIIEVFHDASENVISLSVIAESWRVRYFVAIMIEVALVWKDELRREQVFSENNCVSLALLLSTATKLLADLRHDGRVDFCLDETMITSE